MIDLLAERRNRGLTLDEAASAMKVDRTALWRTEKGISRPEPRNAFKIASFYGYKVTEVWPLEQEPAA